LGWMFPVLGWMFPVLGVIVISAAGNNNADACDYSPASSPKSLTVSSLNVPWMFPECSLNVPWMFPETFTQRSLIVPWRLFSLCWMFPDVARRSQTLLVRCLRDVLREEPLH
jgi:hypothetical protein